MCRIVWHRGYRFTVRPLSFLRSTCIGSVSIGTSKPYRFAPQSGTRTLLCGDPAVAGHGASRQATSLSPLRPSFTSFRPPSSLPSFLPSSPPSSLLPCTLLFSHTAKSSCGLQVGLISVPSVVLGLKRTGAHFGHLRQGQDVESPGSRLSTKQ